MSWTITGEAGKALNATARTPEALNIDQASVVFQSLGPDQFMWTATTTDATGAGTIVPEVGQIVSLLWNGVRKFRGHVTAPRIGTNSVTVTAHGPWWWMQRTPLTQVQADSTGTNSERPSYVFRTGNLATHLAALINRAIANGVPMARGNIAAMFAVPQITIAETDCGTALAELMRWVPDAVAWFDYSTATPRLHISRRTPMTALTLGIPASNIERMDIAPRLDLEVARVELKFVTRDATTGKPKWAAQSNGTNAAGKRQIITISGPEISDALPKDDFESYIIRTAASLGGYAATSEPSLVAARAKYGATIPVYAADGQNFTWYRTRIRDGMSGPWRPDPARGTVSYQLPPLQLRRLNGTAFGGTVFAVTTGNMPEWVGKLPEVRAEDGVLFGQIYMKKVERVDDPDYIGELGLTKVLAGFAPSTSTDIGWEGWQLFARQFSMPVKVIRTAYPTATTLYKPWDYSFLTPPAGLANALRAAQAWVPWEGDITTVADNVTAASNLLGRAINVTGTLTPCATMKALLKSISYDLTRGRTTYHLGAPPRTDYGSLVARVRREPKDNIVFL